MSAPTPAILFGKELRFNDGGGVFRDTYNPQGVLEAAVGSIFLRTNGETYRKLGGGTTKYGWYPELVPGAPYRWWFDYHARIVASSQNLVATPNVGSIGTEVDGTGGQSIQSDAFWHTATSGTTIGNSAGLNANGSGGSPATVLLDYDNWDIWARYEIRELTNVRYWMKFGGTNPTNADTMSSSSVGVTWRFSSVAGDTQWMGFASNASTISNLGAMGPTVTQNTKYLFRLRKVGGTLYLSVNDTAEISTTHTLTTGQMPMIFRVFNTAGGGGSARSCRFNRFSGYLGE